MFWVKLGLSSIPCPFTKKVLNHKKKRDNSLPILLFPVSFLPLHIEATNPLGLLGGTVALRIHSPAESFGVWDRL